MKIWIAGETQEEVQGYLDALGLLGVIETRAASNPYFVRLSLKESGIPTPAYIAYLIGDIKPAEWWITDASLEVNRIFRRVGAALAGKFYNFKEYPLRGQFLEKTFPPALEERLAWYGGYTGTASEGTYDNQGYLHMRKRPVYFVPLKEAEVGLADSCELF